jgi:hypothetical protein
VQDGAALAQLVSMGFEEGRARAALAAVSGSQCPVSDAAQRIWQQTNGARRLLSLLLAYSLHCWTLHLPDQMLAPPALGAWQPASCAVT